MQKYEFSSPSDEPLCAAYHPTEVRDREGEKRERGGREDRMEGGRIGWREEEREGGRREGR
jgi:hypothetical protein